MKPDSIERRRDPRTKAGVPILLRQDGEFNDMQAHLLDLSSSGAAVLAAAFDAPMLGQYLNLTFHMPVNNEDGRAPSSREESGVIVNTRREQHGLTRLGVRFVHRGGLGAGLIDPREMLTNHRHYDFSQPTADRWNIEYESRLERQPAGVN